MTTNRILRDATKPVGWQAVGSAGLVCAVVWFVAYGGFFDTVPVDRRNVASSNFKTEGGRVYLLASTAGGDREWFDITDSPLDKSGYEYGIGKDTIPSIDAPVFVDPDDKRLLKLSRNSIDSTDDLRVIGYADGGEARAYPIGLLDGHELVNDTMSGKPITVGW